MVSKPTLDLGQAQKEDERAAKKAKVDKSREMNEI